MTLDSVLKSLGLTADFSGGDLAVYSPTDGGEMARVTTCDANQVDCAIAAASSAFESWRSATRAATTGSARWSWQIVVGEQKLPITWQVAAPRRLANSVSMRPFRRRNPCKRVIESVQTRHRRTHDHWPDSGGASL